MEEKQSITAEELRRRLEDRAAPGTDLTGYQIVYAWRERRWKAGEDYAFAFSRGRESMWTLALGSSELREIPVKNIKFIREGPSCHYAFRLRRRLRRERYCVPLLSTAKSGHCRCVQLESGHAFHLFCQEKARIPWQRLKKWMEKFFPRKDET